jgi:hypothetical protein
MDVSGSDQAIFSPRAQDPDGSVLGKTITQLLEAFDSPKLEALMETKEITIPSVVNIIIKGIKMVDLYDTLNKPNFTAREVMDAAKLRISSTEPSDRTPGIYTRFHQSNDNDLGYWRTNANYVYVGQSVDFRTRFIAHPTSSAKYGELSRNSRRCAMIAVCILSENDHGDISFAVEQIFVCLFRSYREIFSSPRIHATMSEVDSSSIMFLVSEQLFVSLESHAKSLNRPDSLAASIERDSASHMERTSQVLLKNGVS